MILYWYFHYLHSFSLRIHLLIPCLSQAEGRKDWESKGKLIMTTDGSLGIRKLPKSTFSSFADEFDSPFLFMLYTGTTLLQLTETIQCFLMRAKVHILGAFSLELHQHLFLTSSGIIWQKQMTMCFLLANTKRSAHS